jgi:DNA-directed RNA polymerase subunit RPC12/RpoP
MSDEPAVGIACPYCGSRDTGLMSPFGQQLLTAQYYCRTCLTPFERVKGRDVLADAAEQDRPEAGQGPPGVPPRSGTKPNHD